MNKTIFAIFLLFVLISGVLTPSYSAFADDATSALYNLGDHGLLHHMCK